MRYKILRLVAFASLGTFSLGVAAHHSLQGQFRTDSAVEITGVITDMDWINPHSYVYMNELDEDGNVIESWELETLPTAMFRKAGLTKELIVGGGQPVTVRLHTARDGTRNLGYIIKVTYEDGHFYQLSEEQ